MSTPRRVLVVDDSALAQFALAQALTQATDLDLIAETHSIQDALTVVRTQCPDVAILDHYLPDGSGIVACRQIRAACPHTAVLILTDRDEDTYLAQAKRAGAAGFLSKASPLESLVEAISQAASGQRLWTIEQIHRIDAWEEAVGRQIDELTPREWEVLRLIASGNAREEIGKALHIRLKTLDC
jgi:DNA-binding NarL/FixJ family response regulator